MTAEREAEIRKKWRAAARKSIQEQRKADARRLAADPRALYCEFCGAGPECIVCRRGLSPYPAV